MKCDVSSRFCYTDTYPLPTHSIGRMKKRKSGHYTETGSGERRWLSFLSPEIYLKWCDALSLSVIGWGSIRGILVFLKQERKVEEKERQDNRLHDEIHDSRNYLSYWKVGMKRGWGASIEDFAIEDLVRLRKSRKRGRWCISAGKKTLQKCMHLSSEKL